MATAVMSPDNYYTLTISGDARSRIGLRAAIHEAIQVGKREIVIDCGAWSQLDLGLLGTLVQGSKLCAEKAVHFQLANLSANMRSTIRALRLEQHLGLDAEHHAA